MKPEKPVQNCLDFVKRESNRQRENRNEAEIDLSYFDGEGQWTEDEKNNRGKDRPAVVVNGLKAAPLLVTNQIAQGLPGATVTPQAGPATEDDAEIIEGIIRITDHLSNMRASALTAALYCSITGIGYMGVYIDWVGPDSTEKCLYRRTFDDPQCVMIGPYSLPDASDIKEAVVFQYFTADEYRDRFPGKEPPSVDTFAPADTLQREWMPEEEGGRRYRVAEYWSVEREEKRLFKTPDGDIFEEELGNNGYRIREDASGNPVELLYMEQQQVQGFFGPKQVAVQKRIPLKEDQNWRKSQYPFVMMRMIDGAKVLEETEWPGSTIPIRPVYCLRYKLKGKEKIVGMIRDSRIPQKSRNLNKSLWIESLLEAPKGKWVVESGSTEDFVDDWDSLNDSSKRFLRYKGTVDGQQVQPPRYETFEPPIQGYMLTDQVASADIKQTSNTYDASLGNFDVNARSGKQIEALQQQSGLTNSHVARALADTMRSIYAMDLELIPIVYSDSQLITILGKDMQPKIVDFRKEYTAKNGERRKYNISTGKYNVSVDLGPSHQNQEDKAASFLSDFMKASPEMFAKFADLAVKWQRMGVYGDQIAERLQPPNQQNPNDPQVLQQQMQEMGKQFQQLQQAFGQAQQIIQTKQVEASNAYKIAELNSMTQLRIAELKANAELAEKGIEAQLDREDRDLKIAQEIRLDAAEKFHEENLLNKKHAHEAGKLAMESAHAHEHIAHEHENAVEQQDRMTAMQPQESANA